MRSIRRLAWPIAAFAAVLALSGVVAAGCGGDGGGKSQDEADVEAAIQAALNAWNAGDVDALLALVTDTFLQGEFEFATREQAAQELPQFIGEPQFENIVISNVEVSGDTATAELSNTEGNVLSRDRESLVKEGDAWKIDAEESLAVEIPDGATAVDVTAREFAFDFDESAIEDGNIAFRLTNGGGEQHFLSLAKIPEDLDVEQALQSEEEPAGTEDIGGTDVVEPGDETTMVFAQPLEPGRYVMLCFIETADGTPHALQGMWADFTVPGDGSTPAGDQTPEASATPE